jgi:nicotinamidase-related amidase
MVAEVCRRHRDDKEGARGMAGLSPHLLDRSNVVLVIVDVQERLARVMSRREEVLGAIVLLVRVARALDVPVIVTRQNPDGLGDVVPEIAEALPSDALIVDKYAFCCGAEASFADTLASVDRGQVVLVGMEAHICIAQTALALLERGSLVHVAADAVCSRRDADRDGALARLQAAGAEITCAESVAYELVERAGTEEFRQVLRSVKERDGTP